MSGKIGEAQKPVMQHKQFREKVTEEIELVLDHDLERFSNGFMRMAITKVDAFDGSKEIGSISFDARGTAVFCNLPSGRQWSIDVRQMFNLFQQADELYRAASEASKRKKTKPRS